MIRRPPRSTLDRSSAASDVYKRQLYASILALSLSVGSAHMSNLFRKKGSRSVPSNYRTIALTCIPVSYTHLRAHETPEHLVCRLLLEKKNNEPTKLLSI